MESLVNLDLLSVGMAIVGTVLLGFVVYISNPSSITNKTFFLFSLTTGLLGLSNYISYQPQSEDLILWVARFIMFLAALFSFFFFLLAYVFPEQKRKLSTSIKYGLIPLVIFTAFLSLTPLVFSGVKLTSGEIPRPVIGLGISIHTVVALFCVFVGVVILIKKSRKAVDIERARYRLLLLGVALTFALIIVFNFLFPVFLEDSRFIPLSSLFIFPFVAFTSYAILKHKLFNVRVAGTAVLVFLLSVVTFFEVILEGDLALIIYRSSILILVLVFGVLLIRGVMREVEQREKLAELNKKLQAAYEEVDRLSKAKSEFISIASHQLRTPLSAIKGYISMIIEGTYGRLPEKSKRPLANVYQSNERLINLVNNLLDISRIEAGKMEFELKETQVEDIIDSVVEELKITAEQKKLYLNWEKPKTLLPTLHLDRAKMRQVILNLIHNAIKYTNQGGITIKLKIENLKLKIIIADTGEGMTKEDLGKIFETFSRGTIGTQVSAEGAGLGLYIARKFVEMHQGLVWAESEGRSKGSTFYIELPIK